MTTPKTPLAVVRALYDAFAAKDEDRLRTLLAADVEWNQCAGFPGGARHRGVDAVLRSVFEKNRSDWTDFAAPIDEMIASGSRVVVLGHYRGHHAVTGKSMRADFAHVYRVDAGRVVQFDQVADTWPMVEAAR